MFGKPRLITVWSYGTLTTTLLCVAYLLDSRWSILLMVLAIPSAWALILASAEFIGSRWVDNSARLFDVQQNTTEVRIIEGVARLNEGQLDAIMHSANLAPALNGSIQPRFVKVGSEYIPWLFVYRFVRGAEFLGAIGDYSEGSTERRHAQRITDELRIHGYADESRGPYPARWKSEQARAAGLKMLEIEE